MFGSQTQFPKCYTIPWKGKKLKIVDTPGFADTDDKDEKHLDNIMKALSHYSSIRGICVVIKGSENRLTGHLKGVLEKVFNLMDDSAKKNIIFCYTFSWDDDDAESLIEEQFPDLHENMSFNFDNRVYKQTCALVQIKKEPEAFMPPSLWDNEWEQARLNSVGLVDYIMNCERQPYMVSRSMAFVSVVKIAELLPPMISEVVVKCIGLKL
jgi:hypothetical protein